VSSAEEQLTSNKIYQIEWGSYMEPFSFVIILFAHGLRKPKALHRKGKFFKILVIKKRISLKMRHLPFYVEILLKRILKMKGLNF
jgi:hypothetical protein